MILVLQVAGDKIGVQANIVVESRDNVRKRQVQPIVNATQAEEFILKLTNIKSLIILSKTNLDLMLGEEQLETGDEELLHVTIVLFDRLLKLLGQRF
jgi:hypothetical protein